jgi:hypothetical protein
LRPALCCALTFFALGIGRTATASPPAISVQREPGAEDCPDSAGLSAQVQAIVGHDTSQDATPYRITFTHSGATFTAAIRLASENADSPVVRSLDAHEPTCTALAHATAIALAVLFDSDLGAASASKAADASQQAAPARKPPSAQTPTPPSKRRAPDTSAELDVEPLFGVGGAALVGVLRPVSFGLLADLGLRSGSWRGAVGALWVPPETLSLAPGSARESLLSATLRGCYALLRVGTLRFDGCTGVLLGAASAQAHGFTLDEPAHHELFLAFPAQLAVSGRSRAVGWELGAAALLLCPPNEFRVEGRGVIYRPAPVAGMFTLRVFVEPLR